MNTKYLITIIGPTGVGKTKVAIELAQKFKTSIISADSRQMYKELQIGTATPKSAELAEATHYCINHKSIHDYYNASMYEKEVLDLLRQIYADTPLAIMAGGSGLYIDAVCNGIDEIPSVDFSVREKIKTLWEKYGIEKLRERLQNVDPEYYNQVDLHNPLRIRKALEVYEQTGKPYSAFRNAKPKERFFKCLKIGLFLPRDILYERINKRVDKMINEGLVNEVCNLRGFQHYNALNTVGYKELFGYFNGEYSYEEAVRLIKRNTRRYAKRQLTWFRRDPEIMWYQPDQIKEIAAYINNHI